MQARMASWLALRDLRRLMSSDRRMRLGMISPRYVVRISDIDGGSPHLLELFLKLDTIQLVVCAPVVEAVAGTQPGVEYLMPLPRYLDPEPLVVEQQQFVPRG